MADMAQRASYGAGGSYRPGLRACRVVALLCVCVLACSPVSAQAPKPTKPFEHVIIPGDQLRITVSEDSTLNKIYAVAGDGTIDVNYIGRVSVVEMTVAQAAEKIERLLEETYFREATVTATVTEFVTGSVLVLGSVEKPIPIPLTGDQIMTLTEAISLCGGLTRQADGTRVRILRWKPASGMERQVLTVDVRTMFEKLDFANDQFLRPRDIILVPSLGVGSGAGEYLVLGDVSNPGFHPYSEGLDVIRAITRAGGVNRTAKWDAARLLRADKGGNYSVIPLDLSRLFGAADMSMNLKVLSGDIIFVPSREQASRGQVYVLGQVEKPGSYPLSLDQDMTVSKTIMIAGGFSKFANQGKVKVLRNAPDGSKQTLYVDVGKILETGSFETDVPLENGDVVIVPERMISF